MFVSSLTNSDFSSSFYIRISVIKNTWFFSFLASFACFDKNSALFIFQCTMCAFGACCVLKTTMPTYYVIHWHCPFFNVQCLPLFQGFYCLIDSLFIISHFRVFVKYFFKTFWSFLFLLDRRLSANFVIISHSLRFVKPFFEVF